MRVIVRWFAGARTEHRDRFGLFPVPREGERDGVGHGRVLREESCAQFQFRKLRRVGGRLAARPRLGEQLENLGQRRGLRQCPLERLKNRISSAW